MAQYQHLPIYKTTYELLQVVTRATVGFSKAYKYSLGDKLRAEVVELVVYLYKANSSRGADRVAHATTFLERLQVVELMVRLSKDLRLLNVKACMGKLLRRHGHIVALQNNRMFAERLPL